MTKRDVPVFIVGMNGSGTTMLADSLGNHPRLFMLPLESKVLPYYLTQKVDCADLAARKKLADTIGREKPFWQTNDQRDVILPESELVQAKSVADVIDAIYRHLAHKAGKQRWGDKSPVNTQHIHALSEAFPVAKFIHIVRDGRDAAQSFHRRWGYHPLHTIKRWKRIVNEGIRQGSRIGSGRYMEVRYEKLTTEPEPLMRELCEFIGLEFDPAVLKSSMRYMDDKNKLADSGQIVPNSGKWRDYFSEKTIEAMERIAGAMLNKLGYDCAHAGDESPSHARLRYWRWRDRAVFSVWFFREYGIGAIPAYARHLSTSARQWRSAKY